MICTDSFFESNGHVQYLGKVAEMMKKANNFVFLNNIELEIFINILKKALAESKIGRNDKSTAYISANIDDNSQGIICVYQQKCSDNPVLRLYVHPVNGILEYDLEAKAFFDVSERLYAEGGKS